MPRWAHRHLPRCFVSRIAKRYHNTDYSLITGTGGDDSLSATGSRNLILAGGGGDDIALSSTSSTYLILTGAQADYTIAQDDATTVNGTSYADILYGGSGNDTITGYYGDDTLYGSAGNDTLNGGSGDDTLYGNAGNDTIDGGANGAKDDTVDYFDAAAGVTVDLSGGATGSGQAYSTAANDAANIGVDILTGIENIEGSGYDDILIGDAGANFIDGDFGNDTITGGAGNDTLEGGGGSDTFIYQAGDRGVDIIKGFYAGGGDVLDLTLLTSSQAGDTLGNIINLLDDGTDTTVQVDADGPAGGQTYVDVVTLEGETGLDLATMDADGTITWT